MKDFAALRALIAWQSVPGVGPRVLAKLQDHTRESRLTLGDLWEMPEADLSRLVRLGSSPMRSLQTGRASIADRAALLASRAESAGIEALTTEDPAYPAHLRSHAWSWPVLYGYGAVDLLEQPLVAIVSSRSVGPEGLAWMDRLADALARQDTALVTSFYRQAYQATATAAKRHGGATVLVVDRGLFAAFPEGPGREPVPTARVWDDALDTSTQLLISPFGLEDGWTPGAGPRRDSLVVALAAAVVAVDVRPGGHVEPLCRDAAVRGVPVFALDRGGATPEGTRSLLAETTGVTRLDGKGLGEPSRLARQIAAALPAPGFRDDREETGWRREVLRFVVSLACGIARERSLDSASVTPSRGELSDLLRSTILNGPLGRGGQGAVDLSVADVQHPSQLGGLVQSLRPDGALVALVPARDAATAIPEPDRARILEGRRIEAIIEIPARPAGGEPCAVVIIGPLADRETQLQLLSPRQPLRNRHALCRFLTGALALVHQRRSGTTATGGG